MKKLILFLFLAFFALSWQVNAQSLSEGFETWPPTDWVLEQGPCSPTNDITQSDTYAHGGTYSARFSSYSSCGSGYDEYMITPELVVTAGDQTISFYYRKYSYGSETFRVGWSSTGTDVNTDFTWGPDITNASTSWQQYSKTDLPVGTKYVAIHYKSNYQYYLYIDDVTGPTLYVPACPKPSNQTATNETTSGADLGWTENGSSTHWDLEIGTTGFTPTGTPTDNDVTTNPYTWSGGNAATSYDYYVRADCGADNSDVSGWVGPYTFTTLCNAFTATYSENFDAVSTPDLPLCWSKIVDATSTYAAVETTTTNNSAPNGARLYNSSDNAATLLLITPEFSDLTSQANQIRFYARGDGYDLIIGTMSDPSDQSTFTSFTTLTLTSSFEEYTVSFSTYTGSDTYVAFKHGLGGTYRTIYIDDFNYEPLPACPAPTLQTESNITFTSADLGWTENGSATTWDIELGVEGFTPSGTPTQSGVTNNPYTYGGLTANTSYDWYVRADCGGGDQSIWVGPSTFYTGYCLSTSTSSSTYTDDFTTTGGSTNISNTSSGYATDGYEDATAMSVSSYATGTFDFSAAFVGTTVGFNIWVDWNDDLDFDDAGEKVYASGSYVSSASGTITVPAGTANGNYRMRTRCDYNATDPNPCGERTRAETEDYTLTVVDPPSCPDPSALTATNETTSGADLGWTENGSSTHWDLEIGTTGFIPTGTPTDNDVTTNPYTWSGGNAATSYDFYVRADCGADNSDVSGWVGPYTFTTLCNSESVPWTEGFEGMASVGDGIVPICMAEDGDWATADANQSNNREPHTGTNYVYTKWTADDYLFTPGIDLTGGTSYDFSFWYITDGNSGWTTVEAKYGTGQTSGDMTTTIGTPISDPTNTSYLEFKGSFTPASSGTYYLAIHVVANSSPWYITFDDLKVEETPSCIAPTGLSVDDITTTTADLHWDAVAGASGFNWEIVPAGNGQGNGVVTSGTTTGDGSADPDVDDAGVLSPSTSYDLYVQTDCGGGSTSSWSGPVTFTTLTPPPANDDCSNATVLNCGDNLTGETTDGASDNGDDTGCGMGKGVWYKYVASDIYELTVTATPEAGYDIELSVSTSSDCSTFTNLVCRDSGGSGSAETYTFTTTAGTTYYFYVAHYNNTSTITGDFDISLSCVTCIDPSGQTETNITATSADLDWTENGGASTWEIEWGAQGFTQGSGTTVTGISSKPYTLSGLTAQTDYDWYVRSDCGGGDFSNWTGPHTFTTLSADEVDWCNLQWPDQATITVGSSVNVYAQVYEPGVTDASGQGAGISAWIGYSTTDTDPATWTNWVVATYNVDDGNNDEYQAALGAGLTPGTYYYASRFQLNGGVYKYGGYNAGGGGFWDGTNNVSGILTIDPVVANDDCSGAYTLTVGNGACFDPVTSTNVDATDSHTYDNSIPAPGCANYSGGDLWFKVTVPASGNITIESSRTDGFTDGGIAAYSGDCSNLTLIECNDDGNSNPGTTLHSRLDLTGQTAGSTIYIRVWEYGNDNYGNFAVCAWEPMDAVVSLIGDATCEANLPVSVSHSEGNTYTWVPLVDASDNVIAYIYPYGNVLGDVIATVYRNTSGTIREDDDNIPYLDRDVEITVGGQPTGDNPRLKILYLKSEIDALIAADPAVTTIDDINFTKFETSCSGSYSGQGQPVAQTGNGTVNAANDNYIQCTVSSFSTFYGNRAGYSLPVQLATFSGYAGKDANILQWTTFSEINTAAYYVERSISGKEWSLVDKVEAAGDSYTEKDYSAVDNNPVSKAFYRLHIMDKDGRYSVSKVISIERKDSGLKLNAVYPNPNDGNFVVNLTSEPNAEGKMILVNALGVKVYTKELNVQGGRTIEKIDVSNLPTGVYTLLLEQNNNIITERVIINR